MSEPLIGQLEKEFRRTGDPAAGLALSDLLEEAGVAPLALRPLRRYCHIQVEIRRQRGRVVDATQYAHKDLEDGP